MNRTKRLLAAAALLGVSLVPSPVSSADVQFCDTSCPTANGMCNCPIWTDRPKALTFCGSWNRVGGCWYG